MSSRLESLDMLARYFDNFNDGELKWSVYGGALDGQTRHYRIMYSCGDSLEELEHSVKINKDWEKETREFVRKVLRFLQDRDNGFKTAASDLLVMDPWLYACVGPQIEVVD